MSLKVGITGGIGVGKTFCCRVFEVLGVQVYYADDRAKWLMSNDPIIKERVIDLFGKESYNADGLINRPYLAEKVFGDKSNTKKMNSIVHPAVGKDLMGWFQNLSGPYGLYEAALMFESGSHQFLDRIIVVDAPEQIRIKRIMKRDGISRDEIFARMNKQMPQEDKVAKAGIVINNDGQQSVIRQVLRIHAQLLELAQNES